MSNSVLLFDWIELFIGKKEWEEVLHAICNGPRDYMERYSSILEMEF